MLSLRWSDFGILEKMENFLSSDFKFIFRGFVWIYFDQSKIGLKQKSFFENNLQ